MTAESRRTKRRRWVVIGVLAVLGAAQLVPVGRKNPPVRSDIDAPGDVETILRRSCYDCHSNETRWPWYSRVAPVSWLVTHDVAEGRGEVNFSEWPVADFEARELHLHDIEKQIAKREMPLKIYLTMHREARLTEEERALLVRWTREQY